MLSMVRALGQHWAKGNWGEGGGCFLPHGSDLEQGSECWGSESRKEGHVEEKKDTNKCSVHKQTQVLHFRMGTLKCYQIHLATKRG